MKPCLLLCCLIVRKIKMELSSQISDISGDLIPQQLFGIQQGASAFFLGLFSSLPGHLLSLLARTPCFLSLPACQIDSHWPKDSRIIEVWGGEKGMNAKTHQEIWSECFQGEQLPNLCSSSSATSAPRFAFSPLLPPPRSTKSGEGIWVLGMNHLLNTSLHETLSSLETQQENHPYATQNPTNSIYFRPSKGN